jgi:hypothetical protein
MIMSFSKGAPDALQREYIEIACDPSGNVRKRKEIGFTLLGCDNNTWWAEGETPVERCFLCGSDSQIAEEGEGLFIQCGGSCGSYIITPKAVSDLDGIPGRKQSVIERVKVLRTKDRERRIRIDHYSVSFADKKKTFFMFDGDVTADKIFAAIKDHTKDKKKDEDLPDL